MHHDLTERATFAKENGLKLRERTAKHLTAMTENREYVVTRYEPAMNAISQINEITATLKDVAKIAVNKIRLGAK